MLRTPRPGAGSKQVCDFNEVVLEAGFADQLEQAGGLVARGPERGRDTARLVDVGGPTPPRLRPGGQDERGHRSVEAAGGLHPTAGPAHTPDVGIAQRAGVTRRTFYRHFPDDVSLFKACTRHAMEKWPDPDPDPWRRIS